MNRGGWGGPHISAPRSISRSSSSARSSSKCVRPSSTSPSTSRRFSGRLRSCLSASQPGPARPMNRVARRCETGQGASRISGPRSRPIVDLLSLIGAHIAVRAGRSRRSEGDNGPFMKQPGGTTAPHHAGTISKTLCERPASHRALDRFRARAGYSLRVTHAFLDAAT